MSRRALGEARAAGTDRRATAVTGQTIGELRSPTERLRLGRRRRRARSPRRTAPRRRSRSSGRSSSRLPDWATSSTARDVAAGRPSELDAIAGAVVRAGRRLGVPTPTLEELLGAMPSVIALIPARSGSERVAEQEHPPARGSPAARVRDRDRAAVRRLRSRRRLDRLRGDRRGRALVRRRRPVPASAGVRDVDLAGHRVDRVHARPAARAATTSSRSSVRRIRSAAPTSCGADSSSCSQHLRPTRSVPSSSSSSTPGRCGSSSTTGTMAPLLDQSQLDVAWHAGQYQALPRVYVQNSALEIAWTRVVSETGTREGRVARAVPHRGHEGFNVDDEEDWAARRGARGLGRGDAHRDRSPAVPRILPRMKVAHLETLYCDAGWRPWIFLKATTDDGLVGWAEITDSHGSPRGLAGIVEDLAPLVVGRDPRAVRADRLGSLPRDAAEPGRRRGRRRSRRSRTRCST